MQLIFIVVQLVPPKFANGDFGSFLGAIVCALKGDKTAAVAGGIIHSIGNAAAVAHIATITAYVAGTFLSDPFLVGICATFFLPIKVFDSHGKQMFGVEIVRFPGMSGLCIVAIVIVAVAANTTVTFYAIIYVILVFHNIVVTNLEWYRAFGCNGKDSFLGIFGVDGFTAKPVQRAIEITIIDDVESFENGKFRGETLGNCSGEAIVVEAENF